MPLRDAIYGLAVGDAMGVPYEFRARDSFVPSQEMVGGGIHNQPVGTFSDDTSMTLATCDSLKRNNGKVDIKDMRCRFENWAWRGDYAIDGVVFDVGSTVSRALDEGRGLDGERGNGNGSLMRIVPLAFADVTDDEVCKVSAVTHGHRISTDSCVRYVNAARALENGMSIGEVVGRYSPNVMKRCREDVKSSGFVIDTYETAMWCLINASDYRETVMLAIGLGGDTDTTAAVAGALAGITYGMDSIPEDWMDALRGKDIIESVL